MQYRVEGLIPTGVDNGKYMSLRISLRRGSTREVPNRGLDTSVIESNSRWRIREEGKGGVEVLIMAAKYTQVDNALGMQLRYL